MTIRTAATLLLAGSLALGACKKDAPEDLPPPPVDPNAGANTGNTGPTAPGVGTNEHFVNAVNGQNIIYFDTDRYNIDSADSAALQTQAQYLAQHPSVAVTIEGHADERGTREYNLALGERRANAAKNYLTTIGVAANRISTVSYGEERPMALASTPEAWAQNRRAVTVVVN